MEILRKRVIIISFFLAFGVSAFAQQSDLEKAFSESYSYEYKKEYEKAENTFLNYNKLVIELVEEEEKKEKKYVQLEFEFDEDLVAPI